MTTYISSDDSRLQAAEPAPAADQGAQAARRDLLAHRTAAHLSSERQSIWTSLAEINIDMKAVQRSRLVTMNRSHATHVAIDILRTNVLQIMRQKGWTSLGVTSPTVGCGKTFVALNLAFSIQHQGECRVVLTDLDLKRPQIARSLGLYDVPPISDFLKGDSDVKAAYRRHGTNLAIAANTAPVRYSAELLQSPEAARALTRMNQRLIPDVSIYDLPPMLASDDVLAFLPNLDCVLLVAAAESSTVDEVDICEQTLAEKTNVLGVVLNKCRYLPDRYGY